MLQLKLALYWQPLPYFYISFEYIEWAICKLFIYIKKSLEFLSPPPWPCPVCMFHSVHAMYMWLWAQRPHRKCMCRRLAVLPTAPPPPTEKKLKDGYLISTFSHFYRKPFTSVKSAKVCLTFIHSSWMQETVLLWSSWQAMPTSLSAAHSRRPCCGCCTHDPFANKT